MPYRHKDTRHHRKIKSHVALIAIAKIGSCILGPLIRLDNKNAARMTLLTSARKTA